MSDDPDEHMGHIVGERVRDFAIESSELIASGHKKGTVRKKWDALEAKFGPIPSEVVQFIATVSVDAALHQLCHLLESDDRCVLAVDGEELLRSRKQGGPAVYWDWVDQHSAKPVAYDP